MKKTTSTILAILIAALAPGLQAYASAGEVVRGAVPKPISVGALPVGQGLPSAGPATAGIPSIAVSALGPVSADVPGAAAAPAQVQAPAQAPATAAPEAAARPQAAGLSSISAEAAKAAEAQSDGVPVTALGQAAAAVPSSPESGPVAPSAASASAAASPSGPEDAGGRVFDAAVKGRTLLIVGTLDSRPWLLTETKKTADSLGLKLLLLDKAEKRDLSKGVIADEDFIAADIWTHDPKGMAAVAETVAQAAETRKIDAVYTFLNPFVEIAGLVRDRIGALGNTGAAAAAAQTKTKMRYLIGEKLPELGTPFRIVSSADEARAAFTQISSLFERPIKVVMKPIHGGGSQGVIVDIPSADRAAEAYAQIDKFLVDFQKRPDAGFEMLDTHPGIMMELMLEGPEVDVEIIKSKDKLVFGRVLDNAPMDKPNAVEKNIAAPSQLSAAAQAALVAAASKMVAALGLEFGNFHVEMMMTPEGPRLLEVNARMGGAHVFKVVRRVFGVSLIEQGIRALFGLETDAGKEPSVYLESRFIIPQVTGTIEKIEGLEEAKALAGIEEIHLFKKAGDKQIAAPEDTFDYIGFVSGVGADYDEGMGRALAALKTIKLTIRRPDGSVLVQGADFSHWPVDTNGLLKPVAAEKGGLKDTLKKLVLAVKGLPPSFKSFLAGGALRTMAEEGMAIVTAIYGIAQFGLLAGILSQATELLFRIPGSLFAAKWVKKFDAKKIYIITTFLQGLLYLTLPLGAILLGPASPIFLAQYFFIQVMRGLIYGASRGMAENQIMPKLVGSDTKRLEMAGFVWMLVLEVFALGMAFGLAPLIRGAFGANVLIGIAAVVMLSSVYFFKKIKFADEQPAGSAQADAGAEAAQKAADAKKLDSLPTREYIPYVLSSFLHFSLYGLFAGLFATYTFNNEFMADRQIGSYDGGSLVIALIASIPGLLATLGAAAKSAGPEKKAFLDRFSLKGWYGLSVLAAAGFLWASVAGAALPALVSVALMGALVTINRIRWMSSYQSRLKPERHAKMAAVLNSLAVVAALLPFVAISLSKVLGMALSPVILGLAIAISAGLAVSWLLTKDPAGQK